MISQIQFPLTMSTLSAAIGYRTTVIEGKSGREVRNANWQHPRRKYNAAFLIKNYADISTLNSFFQTMKGRLTGFLLKDYLDFSVDSWTTFPGTRSGGSEQLQLFKTYTDANGSTYDRNIYFPLGSSVTMQQNGVDVSSGAFTVNETTGIVTYTAGAGTTVTFKIGTFYTPVRFDIDELDVGLLAYWLNASTNMGIVQPPDISMVELRLETVTSSASTALLYGAQSVTYGGTAVNY